MPINFSHLKSCLLSGLYCGAICVGALTLQTTFTASAVGQDALEALNRTDKLGTPPAADSQAEQKAKLKKQLSKAFFQELERLVPGEQAEGSPAAEALHTAADAYIERKGAMAMTIFEQSAAANANFPPPELLMAGLHYAAKNPKSGVQAMEQAAVKNPGHPAVYAAYGRLASSANRNVDAMVHFEKVLALLDQGELDEVSVAHYEDVYLTGMSQISLRLKDYKRTRELTSQMLKRDPENGNALQMLASVDFKEGKLDAAIANLTKFREKNPTSRVPEAVLGTWFARSGNRAQANTWFSKLPTMYANDASSQLEYASWALGLEDIEGATAAIAKAESVGEVTVGSRLLKGKIAFFQRNYDDSAAVFKVLHESKPNNPEFANMYVLSMIESSTPENRILANQLANANMQANQNNRVALAALGYVRLRTLPDAKSNQQLKAIFQKVAQTRDGRSPEVDYLLASYLKDIGDNKTALAVLNQSSQYEGLSLYRRQADQMKQALAATVGVLPTP